MMKKGMENADQFGLLGMVVDLEDEAMLENVLPSRVRERSWRARWTRCDAKRGGRFQEVQNSC